MDPSHANSDVISKSLSVRQCHATEPRRTSTPTQQGTGREGRHKPSIVGGSVFDIGCEANGPEDSDRCNAEGQSHRLERKRRAACKIADLDGDGHGDDQSADGGKQPQEYAQLTVLRNVNRPAQYRPCPGPFQGSMELDLEALAARPKTLVPHRQIDGGTDDNPDQTSVPCAVGSVLNRRPVLDGLPEPFRGTGNAHTSCELDLDRNPGRAVHSMILAGRSWSVNA